MLAGESSKSCRTNRVFSQNATIGVDRDLSVSVQAHSLRSSFSNLAGLSFARNMVAPTKKMHIHSRMILWILCFALAPTMAAPADDLDSVLPSLLEDDPFAERETFVGELQRVQRRDGVQRLALVDKGHIVAFLAPTARFRMRQHLGEVVGVVSRSVTREEGQPPNVIIGELKTAKQILAQEGLDVSPAPLQPISRQPQLAPVPRSQPVGSAVRQASAQASVVSPADAEIIEGPAETIEVPAEMMGEEWQVVGDGEVVYGGGLEQGQPGYVDQVIGGTSTTRCVTGNCGHCSHCGPAGQLWVRGEYLLWWSGGMHLPPLVTTSDPGTPIGSAGVLGLDGTSVLVGGEDVVTEGQSGFRIRFGGFLGPRGRLRWEGEYLTLGEETFHFSQRSDGNGAPILARPFFNVNPRIGGTGGLAPPARDDAELVAFPGVVSGIIDVDAATKFQSAGGRLLWSICCKQFCLPPVHPRCWAVLGPNTGYSRVNLMAGYRYANLTDRLRIGEDLTSLDPSEPSRIEITDQFDTRNEFHGGEFGFMWQGGVRRWTLDFYSKVAIGNVHQTVNVDGNTIISFAGPQNVSTGGLLAQNSNIGEYSRDRLGLLPEFGTTLGWYITPRLQATVGYTFVFLSSVARPGEQIDPIVNPDQFAPAMDPIVGPLRPGFAFAETDYWAQGLNVGLDLRW